MATVNTEAGNVLQGKFEGKYVYVWRENVSLTIHKYKTWDSMFSDNWESSKLFTISSDTIKSIHDIGNSVQSANKEAVLKAGFWFGAAAAVAASNIGSQTKYLVAIEYLDGEKSLLELDGYAYKTCKAIEFSIRNFRKETPKMPINTITTKPWKCRFCGAENSDSCNSCTACGSRKV